MDRAMLLKIRVSVARLRPWPRFPTGTFRARKGIDSPGSLIPPLAIFPILLRRLSELGYVG
jgi:hypothetical protein